jgi:hypothetical protein
MKSGHISESPKDYWVVENWFVARAQIPGGCVLTAQTYQDHQRRQGVEGAGLRGLYTQIIINDFLPEYPGCTPFQPGPSEYGATKSWTGFAMDKESSALKV